MLSNSCCKDASSSCSFFSSSPRDLLLAIMLGRSSGDADLMELLKRFFSSALFCDDVYEKLYNSLWDERKQKADEAVRFLQLMEVLPLLKGLF